MSGTPNGVNNELPLGTKMMLFLRLFIKDIYITEQLFSYKTFFKSSFVASFCKNSHTNLEHRVFCKGSNDTAAILDFKGAILNCSI